jgi:ABC-2 type transport system ATP-binding protein
MVDISNLEFSYNTKFLFKELNLQLLRGKIYGLLGKNGAGKTTLLKIICGLIKSDKGTCKVSGYDSYKKYPEMLKDLFFIPETYSLPDTTIEDYERLISPFYDKFDKSFFYGKIEEFEMGRNEKLKNLSYGQKKKFFLIFGLATKCGILVCDEPTNGLDIPTQRQIRKLLVECMFDDRTVIVSTHHVRELENIFDSIIIIDNGKIIFNRELSEINERLSVGVVRSLEDSQDFLYSEEIPGGYSILTRSTGNDGKMDIEFLFNAVASQNEKINSAFN